MSPSVEMNRVSGTYLDILASEINDFTREAAGVIDRARGHLICLDDAMLESNAMIIFTKSRGLMDDSRAAIVRNVRIVENSKRPVLVLSIQLGHCIDSVSTEDTRTLSVK